MDQNSFIARYDSTCRTRDYCMQVIHKITNLYIEGKYNREQFKQHKKFLLSQVELLDELIEQFEDFIDRNERLNIVDN